MMNFSKAVRAKILDTTSSKIGGRTGQEVTLVFRLEAGKPVRFYLREEGTQMAYYESGHIPLGVLASAFDPSVMEIVTEGYTVHHIQVLDKDVDLGFAPKVVVPRVITSLGHWE